ncbi:isochorismatase family protein (plasmid) [Microvirga lotononidis]|nr:isochorismatase family protein [Microvirga lotononidis]
MHTILTSFGIRTAAICGMLSDMCLAATARAVMEHGYGVLLPHDAHATYDIPAGLERRTERRVHNTPALSVGQRWDPGGSDKASDALGSEAIPAAIAARAAEWSLGDEIKICAASHEVRFVAARSDSPAIF